MNKKGILSLLLVLTLLLGGCVLNPEKQDDTPRYSPVLELTEPEITDPTEPEPTLPPLPATDTTPPAELGLTAHTAFVYDPQLSCMLYLGGDGDAPLAPASLTKLMTSYTARQIMDADHIITAGNEVDWIDPMSSRAWVGAGHQLTVEMLIQGMMMPSGNDAAYVVAVGGGRVLAEDPQLDSQMALNVFMDEMNAQARALGMVNSHFVNPDGIDAEGHYTTANDLAILATAVLQDELIMTYAGTAAAEVVFASGESITWKNSNCLLHPEMEKYYTPEAVGMKTGSTENAGKCLISAFLREDDTYLIIGVLGSTEDLLRYDDTLILYDMYR